jgi:hypothetical protein
MKQAREEPNDRILPCADDSRVLMMDEKHGVMEFFSHRAGNV